MDLTKVTINNFRSIVKQEIEFTHRCIGLIGLNEAGKSNVLLALRLFQESYQVSEDDASMISGQLPVIDMNFTLTDEDTIQISNVARDQVEAILFSEDEIGCAIKSDKSVTYSASLVKNEKGQLTKSLRILYDFEVHLAREEDFKSYDDQSPLGMMEVQEGDSTFKLSQYWGADRFSIKDAELHKHFMPLKKERIKESVKDQIDEWLLERIPTVAFWQYDKKFLLPAEITYDEFIKDSKPYDNSAPLYNGLLLSKDLKISSTEDLAAKITSWRRDSRQRRKDSTILTEQINNHIQGIWSDYNQEISIGFEESKITIHVNDPNSDQKNFYPMEARSQGFKTFISFILTAAAEAQNGLSGNVLLLLDEPETHLHPSGARFMRQELLKLADKGHYIVYATNSIFMIDRAAVERHIIVKKQHEVTTLTRVKSNNLIQETVVYEAMGTRVDEFSIGLHNIVLEGNLDLVLLSFFLKYVLDEQQVKNAKKFRLWNGGGTNNIEKFLLAKMLPLDSIWHVILDRDSPGLTLPKNLSKKPQEPSIKLHFHYYSDEGDFEVEDILPKKFLIDAFGVAIKSTGIDDAVPDFENDKRPYSTITNEFKTTNIVDPTVDTSFEIAFKDRLESIVVDALERMKSITDHGERRSAFSNELPDYYKFALNFSKNLKKK